MAPSRKRAHRCAEHFFWVHYFCVERINGDKASQSDENTITQVIKSKSLSMEELEKSMFEGTDEIRVIDQSSQIPEFPKIALPIFSVIGLLFFSRYRKRFFLYFGFLLSKTAMRSPYFLISVFISFTSSMTLSSF